MKPFEIRLMVIIFFLSLFFSLEVWGLTDPIVTHTDGSETWYAGFTSSCPPPLLCDYTSDTDDPMGPWFGESVHFRGIDYGGSSLVYNYRLDFEHEVEISSIVLSGAAWHNFKFLDKDMNLLKGLSLPGGNELQTFVIHTFGPVGDTFHIEESDDIYTYFRYRTNIEVNFSHPCASEAEIILDGIHYSDVSALWDGEKYGWQIDGNSILTWWDEFSSGGTEIWVEYEAFLTKGVWDIGLCAINHSHLGREGLKNDPTWYPYFEVWNSLTGEIFRVPASDLSLNSGFVTFYAPADDTYTVRYKWINDKTEGELQNEEPKFDANIKIARVFFDKVAEPVTIDINPDTLNLMSKGNYITCYIEGGLNFDANAIDVNTVTLNIGGALVGVDPSSPISIGDYNDNGKQDLMVKFDRQKIQEACTEIGTTEMLLTCMSFDGIEFVGTDTVNVIKKGKEHFSSDHGSIVY